MTSQHNNESGQHPPHDMPSSHDHGGITKFVWVFIALCLLTSASIFTYTPLWHEIFPSPRVGWAFMMAVSCAKAMLVISFFMHLYWEAAWKYVVTIPAVLMSVFLVSMLVPDIGMRGSAYSTERLRHAAQPPALQMAGLENLNEVAKEAVQDHGP